MLKRYERRRRRRRRQRFFLSASAHTRSRSVQQATNRTASATAIATTKNCIRIYFYFYAFFSAICPVRGKKYVCTRVCHQHQAMRGIVPYDVERALSLLKLELNTRYDGDDGDSSHQQKWKS